jgi:uncharacterized protein YkwD
MRTSLLARNRRFFPQLDELETRLVPAVVYQPTAQEQLLLEQLNDARANPAAYGASIGLDLSNVAPAQPLAFDPRLIQAAELDAQDMSNRNFFAHVNPDGLDPGQRITAAGFNWNSYGESIAAGYTDTGSALQGLIIDTGVPDLGHRNHLLAIDALFKNQEQAGIGVVLNGSGQYHNYYVIDTAYDGINQPFITGVVYNDANGNNKYDIGEGLGGVTISIAGIGPVTTYSSGGYSVRVNPGTYTVTASGGGLSVPFTQTVTVGSQNARLNFNGASLSAPTLNNLGGQVNALRPSFSWNSVTWASTYNVWVDDLSSGQSKALYITGLTGTSWTANAPLTPGHSYRWWVQGVNGTGGIWSKSQDFTIALSGSTLTNPAGTISTSQPAFTWSSVPWAQSYVVWVNDVTTGQNQAYYVTSLTTTSWTPATPLSVNNTYRWWVESVGENNAAVWSASKDFTFSLTAPTPVGPTTTAAVLQPSFSWNTVAWASSYNVWVDDLTTHQSQALYSSGLTGTSWTPTAVLNPGHAYRWWVQGVGGGNSVWSGSLDFTLSLATPSVLTPNATVTATQLTFSWNGVAWASSYNVWVNDVTTGQNQALYVSGLTGTSWTPTTALTTGHTYRTWVQAVGAGNVALWGNAQDFTVTLAAPNLQGPAGSITSATPTFAWNSVPWAQTYDVWVNDLTTGQSKTLYAPGLAATTWTATASLTAGHNYRWWVQAVAGSNAVWSASQDFAVQGSTTQNAATDPGTYGATIPTTATKIVNVSNSTQLAAALKAPTPGTWILLQPGTYAGGLFASNFSGTAAAPIVIGAADPNNRPIIQGGASGCQLSDINYVVIRDLEFTGATTYGLNIDDGGTFSTPSTYITLTNLYVHDVGSTGIENGIKLSGLQNFRVENCTIKNWGQGGCGIDMVGCYNGCIQNSSFQFQNIVGAGGVQAKGGSTNITIRNNIFNNAGGVGVQAGGWTGAQYFRQATNYEGSQITITHNVIIGSQSAVAFVNAVNCVASFNTIYNPTTWVMRILEPNTTAGFVPTGNDLFTDNIVYFNGTTLQTAANVGVGTAAQTFTFARNWWYNSSTPSKSQPTLPASEVNGSYGTDPLFVNPLAGDFHLQAGSKATKQGAYAS